MDVYISAGWSLLLVEHGNLAAKLLDFDQHVLQCHNLSTGVRVLSPGHASRSSLHHGSVLLLEARPQALRALHPLVHTAHDTALFPRDKGFCCEVVDAVIETALNQFRVHLRASQSAITLLILG